MTATLRPICIVDDNADYLLLLKHVFRRSLPTHTAHFFAGGQALLDALSQLNPKPGLIILDRHMPGLDGHQTLIHLRQHWAIQTTPIVMMSAEASSDERQGCYRSGANSFLAKEHDAASLKNTLTLLCHYWLDVNQR